MIDGCGCFDGCDAFIQKFSSVFKKIQETPSLSLSVAIFFFLFTFFFFVDFVSDEDGRA